MEAIRTNYQSIKYQLVLITSIWMLGAVYFSMCGDDLNKLWWIFDKVNDRLFEFSLVLLIASIFKEWYIKLFSYSIAFYVFLRGYFEVTYLYYSIKKMDLNGFPDVLLTISGIWAGMVIFLSVLHAKKLFR